MCLSILIIIPRILGVSRIIRRCLPMTNPMCLSIRYPRTLMPKVSRIIRGYPPMTNPLCLSIPIYQGYFGYPGLFGDIHLWLMPCVWVSAYSEDTQSISDYPRMSTHDCSPMFEYPRTLRIPWMSRTIRRRPPMTSPYVWVSTYTEDTRGILEYPRMSTHDWSPMHVWVSSYIEDTMSVPGYLRTSTYDQPPVSGWASAYTEDTQNIPRISTSWLIVITPCLRVSLTEVLLCVVIDKQTDDINYKEQCE